MNTYYKCIFCNSNLIDLNCLNHKIIVRFSYDLNRIGFEINEYTLVITKNNIMVYITCPYRRYKMLSKIDNNFQFQITPDNAESVLCKLLSLNAFS